MTCPVNFEMAEFLHSDTANSIGVSNYPTWDVADNLKRLGDTMDEVRRICGDNSVTVSSGYRSPPVNSAVGGAENSAHLSGLACDFAIPGFGDPHAVCKAIEPYMVKLGIDQLIWEYNDWVHLGLCEGAPRHQCLTINNAGTFEGF